MATASLTGRLGTLYASTAAASTATSSQIKVAELTDFTLVFNMKTIDVTSHDSSGWKESLAGIRDWSGTANVNYLSTGAGQGAIRAITLSAATPPFINATFAQTTSKTAKKYQGQVRLVSFDVSHGTDAAILGKISMEGTGKLTRTA